MTKILVRFVKFRMTDNLEIHKVKERIKMTKLFNRSTIQRVKAYAFTLAEILIVIGIIGVVAALTLPNLNHATGDKEKVTKVKKIYSALNDAYGRAEAIYGPIDEWFEGLTDIEQNKRFAKRMIEFMKISKDCAYSEGCWTKGVYFDKSGQEFCENYYELLKDHTYFVNLSDGTSLAFVYNNRIKVDIDGPNKGKNREDTDIFDFGIDSLPLEKDFCEVSCFQYREITPACLNHQNSLNDAVAENWHEEAQYYGAAWVIQNGNLDYLKCQGELDWDTQTSCK